MWQRIQTVFLAVAIISLLVTIFLPIWVYQDASGQSHQLYPLHYTIEQNGERTTQYFPYALTAILAIAAVTLAVISVRNYRNRMLQMKLGALNSLFMAGTIAAAVIFSNQFVKSFQGGHYGLGLWLPGIAVICNLVANRFIRRDEKLVRDSDRLR
jgi:type IV secretory pathway TrbD component